MFVLSCVLRIPLSPRLQVYRTHRCSASCHLAGGDADRLKCWRVCVICFFMLLMLSFSLSPSNPSLDVYTDYLNPESIWGLYTASYAQTLKRTYSSLKTKQTCYISTFGCLTILFEKSHLLQLHHMSWMLNACFKRIVYMQFLWYFNGAFVASFRTWQPLVPIHLLWKLSLMFDRGKKVKQVRNDTRVSKQWQKCPFTYSTKTSVSFIYPVHRWLLNSSRPFKLTRQCESQLYLWMWFY